MNPKSATLVLLCLSLLLPTLRGQQARGLGPDWAARAALADRLGSGVAWVVNDPVLLEEGRNRAEVRASRRANKGFDRIQAMDRALAQAKSKKRPVLWYVPRILAGMGGRQMYRPALPDLYARSVFFSDPECVDLLNRRFIPLRLFCDAPLGKRFGITAPDRVEPALVIIAPDGKVIRIIDRVRSFNAAWLEQILRKEAEKFDAPSAALEVARKRFEAKEIDGVELIHAHLRDGLLDQTVKMVRALRGVAPIDTARAWVLAAKAHRRMGKVDDAQEDLALADKALEDAKNDRKRGLTVRGVRGEVAAERGRIQLLTGRIPEARRSLMSVSSRSPARAEARYLLGLLEFFDGRESMAVRAFQEAALAGEDDPWAWKAAVNLIDGLDRTPLGPALHGFEDPFAPIEGQKASTDTSVPRSPGEARDLARAGLEFLLRMQRTNGSWSDSRYAYWGTIDLTPNVWMAATSLACAALLEWKELDPERVEAALKRGEAYLFDDRNISEGANEEIYAQGYRLLYLCRRFDLERSAREKKSLVGRMDAIVARLDELQSPEGSKAVGNFAHEYPNAFCTASVMNSLHLAKERGAKVPQHMMLRGAEALLASRSPDGSYSYSAGRRVSTDPKRTAERLKNSVARAPICEAAILWSKNPAGDVKKVEAALDNFWKYLPRLERIRKCDFHTDGELGGFFFWHGIFHTTETIKALPSQKRRAQMKKMLKFLTTLGELDGSFIDSHELGKSYGTAMGLLSLKNAMGKGKP